MITPEQAEACGEMLVLTKRAASDEATLAEKKAEHMRQGGAALADEQKVQK